MYIYTGYDVYKGLGLAAWPAYPTSLLANTFSVTNPVFLCCQGSEKHFPYGQPVPHGATYSVLHIAGGLQNLCETGQAGRQRPIYMGLEAVSGLCEKQISVIHGD